MAEFKLIIEYPYYREMLGGGFPDTREGYVAFTARNQASALKKVPALVRKYHRKIDGKKFEARPLTLVLCTEHVVKKFAQPKGNRL